MWIQAIAATVGIWLMASPAALGYGPPAATNAWIVGPLIFTFACIAAAEATRSVRWANVPLGVWLLVAPILLQFSGPAAINCAVVGAATIVLSAIRGRITHKFGGGWSALWRSDVARHAEDHGC